MKKRVTNIVLLGVGMFLLSCILYIKYIEQQFASDSVSSQLVLLNEIEQLTTDEAGNNPAAEQIAALQTQFQSQNGIHKTQEIRQMALAFGGFFVLWMGMVLFYLYRRLILPFQRLEGYTGEIAKGNLAVSLSYEKTNFFGAFTWAFDHMRQEILRARKNEMQAVEENKTIIATLSHDIKTPIASIRAYAEGLEANLEADYEGRQRYLQVIMRKCDEVTALTDDLVLHSLSELEKLEIHMHTIEIKSSLTEILRDLEYKNLRIISEFMEAYVEADEKRLAQVIENILNNARKYAPGAEVEIWTECKSMERLYEIHIRDHGAGVLPEDMPFLMDKFYRGKNAGDASGSGLGLYIVSYIMRRMDGEVELLNSGLGLEVILKLPVSYKINTFKVDS